MSAPAIPVYAPLKPPGDPTPSGDRAMARALLDALAAAGYRPWQASALRARDAHGDPERQRRIRGRGLARARTLIARLRADPPPAWLTYHLYDKAPDWIGPAVCAALGVPYVVVEASLAPRRAAGPHALGHAQAAAALARADLVLQPNPADMPAVAPHLKPGARQLAFPPFLDTAAHAADPARRPARRARLAAAHDLDPGRPWLVCAAMMRPGAKRESYAGLAEALARLPADAPACHLLIAGDGAARPDVADDFAGDARVRFLGALPAAELHALLAAGDLYVWPAIGEAYGRAVLEAQAAGLPVLAGDRPGIAAMVRAEGADGPGAATARLVPAGDAAAFAEALAGLLAEPARRAALGRAAAAHVRTHHDIAAAAGRLGDHLATLR